MLLLSPFLKARQSQVLRLRCIITSPVVRRARAHGAVPGVARAVLALFAALAIQIVCRESTPESCYFCRANGPQAPRRRGEGCGEFFESRVVDAYLQMHDHEKGLTEETVWEDNFHRRKINERYGECLLNDREDEDRGLSTWKRFMEQIYRIESSLEDGHGGQPAHASCICIAEKILVPAAVPAGPVKGTPSSRRPAVASAFRATAPLRFRTVPCWSETLAEALLACCLPSESSKGKGERG